MGRNSLIEVQTTDILEDVVALLERTITITKAEEPSAGVFELTFDEIFWLTPVCVYDIDGSDYIVVSIDDCNVVTFKGDLGNETLPDVGDTITLQAPFFWHGTVRLTSIEWDQISDDLKTFPAVYAVEPITDNFNNVPGTMFDRTSDVTFFVITSANQADWFTDEHYANVINPMRRLTKELKSEFEKAGSGIGRFDSFRILNHANLGVVSANKGHTSGLNNYKVSGVEFDISLPIKTDLACKYACK